MVSVGDKVWGHSEGKAIAGEVVATGLAAEGYDTVVLYAETFEAPAQAKPAGPVVMAFGRGCRPRFAYVWAQDVTKVR